MYMYFYEREGDVCIVHVCLFVLKTILIILHVSCSFFLASTPSCSVFIKELRPVCGDGLLSAVQDKGL